MDAPFLEHDTPRLQEAKRLAEAREWRALADLAGAVPRQDALAEPQLGYLLADALRRTGRTVEALELAGAVEEACRGRGDRPLQLRVVNLVGMARFEAGQMTEAEERFGALLEVATEWGDDEFAARSSNNLGVLANVRGRRELALTYYQRALAAYQRLGHARGLAQTHHNLGICYRDLGFAEEADVHYRRAIDLAQRSGSPEVHAMAELERATLRVRSGDGSLAESLATSALRRFEAVGDPLGQADAMRVLGGAARLLRRDDLALDRLEKAFAVATSHADPLLRAEVQRDRGLLLRDLGRAADAREALLDSIAHFEQLGATHEAAAVRALIGTAV